MEKERSDLRTSIKTLEGELEEVQVFISNTHAHTKVPAKITFLFLEDNFREDEADEYRNLKRELELALKNCRVLQFKLKKAEKTLAETNYQKESLERKWNQVGQFGPAGWVWSGSFGGLCTHGHRLFSRGGGRIPHNL